MSANFGKYLLVKKLATGGMAEVWLAKHLGIEGFERHVVVKRILPHLAEDDEFVRMFLNEAKLVARLNHPNIAPIYDFGQEQGTYYLSMEFVHGEDLGRVMRKAWSTGQWIARPLAIRIVASAAEGLYYAHSRADDQGRPLRIVHRDISPQNILISFDGSVKLVDFGIAKAADQISSTKSGAIKGKFAYMSPEQASGKPLDGRSDIFALGLVLYELLTGVRPIKRDSELATLQAAMDCKIDAPSEVAEVPSELDEVVMRALRKDVDERYRDAREFQMALEEFLIAQRLVATSAQVSELMETLFADRRAEELRLGGPNPKGFDSQSSAPSIDMVPPSVEEPAPRESAARLEARRETRAAVEAVDLPPPAPKTRQPPNLPRRTVELPEAERGHILSEGSLSATDSQSFDGPTGESASPGAPEPEPAPARPSSEAVKKPSPQRRSALRPALEEPSIREEPSEVSVPSIGSDVRRQVDEAVDDYLAKEGKQIGRGRFVRPLVNLAVIAAVVGAAYYYQEPLKALVARPRLVGTPVVLTVVTDPGTTVWLKSPGLEQRSLGPTPLGPLHDTVAVGDTIVIMNSELGIYREEVVAAVKAGAAVELKRVFHEGTLLVKATPPLPNLSVWRGEQKLAVVGVPVKLYEGRQVLEVRGEALKEAVSFTADVKPGGSVTVSVPVTRGP